jgi:hypothetical protein
MYTRYITFSINLKSYNNDKKKYFFFTYYCAIDQEYYYKIDKSDVENFDPKLLK